MEILMCIISLLGIISLIKIFIKYSPNVDLVDSKSKYLLLLWYNKSAKREYIKLLEINKLPK